MAARPFPGNSAAALAGAALFLWSCGSTSVSVTAPTGAKCQVSAAASAESAPAAGTTGTLSITTNRDCTWTASSAAAWISITSNTSGQGDGTVSYRVCQNTDPVSRRGMLAVNDAQVMIAQDPAPCRFTVTPASSTVAAAGGALSAHVDAHSGCAWTAASQVDWIQVAAGASGSGVGNVSLSVTANSGPARTGNVTVAGQTISIVQSAPDTPSPGPPPPLTCEYSLSPASASADAGPTSGSFALTASAPSCPWTVVSNTPWVSVTTATTGTGSAAVGWSASPNLGPGRTGTLTVAGQVFTVVQAGTTCSYALSPSGQTVAASGGPGSFSVATGPTCGWTASASDPWISLSGGAAGTGPGSVSFTVAPNSGAARTGTVTAGGQSFLVAQEAAAPVCSYAISAVP